MGWLEDCLPALVVVVDCIVIMLFYMYAPKRRFMLYFVGALAVYIGVNCFFQKLQPVEVLNRILPIADATLKEYIFVLAVIKS